MKNQNLPHLSQETQRAINSMVLQGTQCGIRSFILGYKDINSRESIVHLQNIPAADAINVINQAWIMVMTEISEKHPEYSEDYKSIFRSGLKDFKSLIENINKKVEAYNKKSK